MRLSCLAAIAVFVFGSAVARANADPKSDIDKKIKEAMDSYDSMDYDASKKLLVQAIAVAKKSKLEKTPSAAKAYLDLGIVAFVNNDADGARTQFATAVSIDPKIQIDPAYKSPELSKLLEEARGEAKGKGGGKGGGEITASSGGGEEAPGDCTGVKGLEHALVDSAPAGAPLKIEAMVGNDVKSSKVSVMFRPEGASEFIEVKMTKSGCKYTGTIPASGMKGGLVHYYVAAYGENGKPVASKGSAGSPNILELTGSAKGGATVKADEEDPLGGGKKAPDKKVAQAADAEKDTAGEVDKGAQPAEGGAVKVPHVFLAVGGGMGGGYLSGSTEKMNPVMSGGLGPSLLVLQPEVGYYITPKFIGGVVVRVGLPIDANVDGHATAAFSFLLRGRYDVWQDGPSSVHVFGQLGYGILRNTLSLNNPMPGMDKDVVAMGPILIGGGAGYAKKIASSVTFFADVSLLGAIATGSTLGSQGGLFYSPAINSGFNADVAIGLALGL